MSKVLVVSQPMFLPWVGLFEQVKLSDVFIHYDDVQLPQGRNFMYRVQIKTPKGASWLTAPIDRKKSGKLIKEAIFFNEEDWRSNHLKKIRHNYAKRPYFHLMLEIVEKIYSYKTDYLSEFNINAIQQIAQWLGISRHFLRSSTMNVAGASTQRLLDLCQSVNCDIYLTGHGAMNYLNHELFESKKISVYYIDYRKKPYNQGYGEFTPYVSILDSIANCGEQTRDLLCSNSVYWKNFLMEKS